VSGQPIATVLDVPELKTSPLVHSVIGAAIAVHRALGPGLLDAAYEECLACEMTRRGIAWRRQVALPVIYESVKVDCGFRVDFVVEDRLLLELKSVEQLHPVHISQLLTYLKLTHAEQGLLINFNVSKLTDGIKSYLSEARRPPCR
jgi:GxxExxY protein